MTLVGLLPSLTKVKKLRFVPKPIEDFFIGLMESSLKHRKSQGVNEDRVDFLNYMLHLQEKKNLTLPELTSHTMTFLLDGFDTTANALAHCLLLVSLDRKFYFCSKYICFLCNQQLARNPDKQNRLREEILDNLGKDNNNFEDISGLEYLDACIHGKFINLTKNILKLYIILSKSHRNCKNVPTRFTFFQTMYRTHRFGK